MHGGRNGDGVLSHGCWELNGGSLFSSRTHKEVIKIFKLSESLFFFPSFGLLHSFNLPLHLFQCCLSQLLLLFCLFGLSNSPLFLFLFPLFLAPDPLLLFKNSQSCPLPSVRLLLQSLLNLHLFLPLPLPFVLSALFELGPFRVPRLSYLLTDHLLLLLEAKAEADAYHLGSHDGEDGRGNQGKIDPHEAVHLRETLLVEAAEARGALRV